MNMKQIDINLSKTTRRRALFLLLALVTINILIWLWALMTFKDSSGLLGTALLAYSFGLRHAVDADHIAAIDNITRKLMQQGKKPLTVGTYFSLGHSTIVIVASAAIAATALAFKDDMAWFHETGGIIGTLVSSLFLLLVGVINLVILIETYKKFRAVKKGKVVQHDDLDILTSNQGGMLSRLFRPLFNAINHSWQMYLIGFLFGLGFDTATEVGLLGISAASATHGMSLWAIMIFPLLFAAGMALIDTLDNFVMVGAYGWAFANPLRKLYYNVTITAASVVVALFIGGVEALGLLADKFEFSGLFWDSVSHLNDHLGDMGYWVIGLFILCWGLFALNYRLRGYDKLAA